MNSESHPYQVSVWIQGNNNPKRIFEKGYWQEFARCITKSRAEEIALSMSFRHPDGVQVAELIGDEHGARFIGYRYMPEAARELK